ncbi:MAG: dephospho-CoA kinase [Pseudomonadota bacterium]
MKILGLTGSIGMGKSTTAQMFADEGVAVWDADAAVHRLYAAGGKAVAPVLAAFPDVAADDGGIDRTKLSRETIGNRDALGRLEGMVHPLVREDQGAFIAAQTEAGAEFALLDIPLLAESGMAALFHAVIVVTADPELRRKRVLERPGMTEEKLDGILERQASEEERLAIANFVVRTDEGLEPAREQVREILARLRASEPLDKPGEAE